MEYYGLRFNKAQHILANASSSARSNSINAPTQVIRLQANVPVYFEYGTSADLVANSTSHYLSANYPIDIKLYPGLVSANSNMYVAVLSLSGSAMLHISETE